MLKKLQERWKVNGWNLLLVLCTFALGGSLCGYAGRKLLLMTGLEKGILWIILYILLVTLLWPLCVLIISIPLGQFRFFKNYISRIWHKMRGHGAIKVAIFASGSGTNAEKIIRHFAGHKKVKIALVVCNKPGAGVLQIAQDNGINTLIINNKDLDEPETLLHTFRQEGIGFLVLAGFLKQLPGPLVKAYQNRIVNIHPALLPAYGGKGMYGHFVHEAVIANREKQSGISIHYVDELYDHGETIFQATCKVADNDTAASLAKKVQQLEHEHYPVVLEKILQNPR